MEKQIIIVIVIIFLIVGLSGCNEVAVNDNLSEKIKVEII